MRGDRVVSFHLFAHLVSLPMRVRDAGAFLAEAWLRSPIANRLDNGDVLAAPVLDAATVRIAAIDADPVLVQYIGGTFVTIFPAAVALAEPLRPMNA